jgi:hypothetical protein
LAVFSFILLEIAYAETPISYQLGTDRNWIIPYTSKYPTSCSIYARSASLPQRDGEKDDAANGAPGHRVVLIKSHAVVGIKVLETVNAARVGGQCDGLTLLVAGQKTIKITGWDSGT